MRITDQYDEALAALDNAGAAAEVGGLDVELAQLHHLRGNIYFPLGNLDGCLEQHEVALKHASVAGSREYEARARGGLGDANYMGGMMKTANGHFRGCVELSRENGFMQTWQEFREARPHIAEAGEKLLYQFGVALAFISTVRKDGGPRIHPICPLINEGHLYFFAVGKSPKRYDLDRDGRYALHTFPPAENDDEFYCAGRATAITDPELRQKIASMAKHNVRDDEVLFELHIERALYTTWENPRQPDTHPIYTKWSSA